METSRDNIIAAVAIDVSASHCDEMCRTIINLPGGELLPSVVFQPNEARMPKSIPVIHHAHQYDIPIQVTVKVTYGCGVSTPKRGKPVRFEFPVPAILEPEATVIRLRVAVNVFEVVSDRE